MYADILPKTESKGIEVLCSWFSPTADPKVLEYSNAANKVTNQNKIQLSEYSELTDRHINAAQELMKLPFPDIDGLRDTLLQNKSSHQRANCSQISGIGHVFKSIKVMFVCMTVETEDIETATTDVSMMHNDDDALVEGDPEKGPVHLDLGSDSDVLISLGAKPH